MISRRGILGSTAAALSMLGTTLARVGSAATARGDSGASALKGKIIFKGDKRYEAYRQAAVWNARKPNRFPEAIVMAESVEDVVAAVRLAKERDWKVGTRSGGHGWVASHMRENAILINISRMKEIKVDPAARIAVVSPAWQGQAFNKILREQYDLMFPSGHCYGIGLGGFIMAGGHGWNSRLWGPGCAQLIALDLVDANGEVVHASETENSEYLWAARGGGAGFPGVAVRFYLKVYPRPHAMKYSHFTYPLHLADEVLHWFGEVSYRLPKYMEASAHGVMRNGQPVVRVTSSVMAYAEKDADAALGILESCPVLSGAVERTGKVPTIFPADNESPSTLSPTGARYVTDGVWSNASTDEVVKRIRPFCENFPARESWYLWMIWGELQKLPDMAYSLQGHHYLSPNAVWYDPADDEKCAKWAADCIDATRDIANGGQMNDDNMAVNGLRYLSPEAEKRLGAIQKKFDPEGRFAGFLL